MKIEIMKGYEHLTPRTINKGKENEVTVFDQKAYAHLGGPFPTEFRITHRDHNTAYPVGMYSVDDSSYRVGRWGDLELNNREMKLNPVSSFEEKKAS
ncbi:MAG: single-stranded DNA-binding protein [Pseudomonadota bacterium]|nr:single-stranded DNA-binding protein [Pseudomonadota bacterium]